MQTANAFHYENLDRDLPTLKPAERPCVLAGMLCGRLMKLSFQAQNLEHDLRVQEVLSSKSAQGPCERAASSVTMAVDLLQRLFLALYDTSTLLALREVHEREGRKVRVAGGWYGSYCVAAIDIGRKYYCAISSAADDDEFGKWLLADVKESRGYDSLPDATIQDRWPDIAQAIVDLPEVDWDELELGISNEHLAVRKAYEKAHREKLFPGGVPDDTELVDVAVRIDSELAPGRKRIDIVRDYYNGDSDKAKKLDARLRKMESDNKLSLPKARKRTKRT